MAYNIKLFVHGNPDGQDIWGNPEADAKYLEAFYGRQSNVSSQMLLEVMQFGGETNAYYTYYCCNGIQEKSGRITGYFALTLRINYYYADVQNIYHLLEAAFNKYIIGTTLEGTTGGGYRFKISQFKQVSNNLNALEKELEHYLMQFSNDKDFMSLGGFKSNGQNEIGIINLLEAVPNVVVNHVKTAGKISVSPLHPTSKEQQIINKMNSEVQAANYNAQQQIAAAQQKAQQDVQAAQRDKEQGILAIKNEYKEADKTISQLRNQIDKDNKDITRLSAQVNDLTIKLQNAQAYKTGYEESQRKLEKTEKLVTEIKKNLSGLSGISELLGISSSSTELYGEKQDGEQTPEDSSSGFASFIKRIHPFMDFFVMLILLLIIAVTLPKSCNSKGNCSDVSSLLGSFKKETIEQKDTELTEKPGTIDDISEEDKEQKSSDDSSVIKETLKLLQAKYPNARIDISNIDESEGKFMQYGSGSNYNVKIVGVDEDLEGEWDYDLKDFYVQDDNLIPMRAGSCRIAYKVNGIKFLERTITVKQ